MGGFRDAMIFFFVALHSGRLHSDCRKPTLKEFWENYKLNTSVAQWQISGHLLLH